MDDTVSCPICGNKMRTVHLTSKFSHTVNKTANYTERVCSSGMNHTLQLFTDKATNKVDLIILSLNHKYSRYLEIDYVNQKSRIMCAKESKIEYIEIDKILEPDFPDLTKLKEKVSLYVVFS